MSYRDEILEYVGDCLDGIMETLREPRVKELSAADIAEIHIGIQDLDHHTKRILAEKREEEKQDHS